MIVSGSVNKESAAKYGAEQLTAGFPQIIGLGAIIAGAVSLYVAPGRLDARNQRIQEAAGFVTTDQVRPRRENSIELILIDASGNNIKVNVTSDDVIAYNRETRNVAIIRNPDHSLSPQFWTVEQYIIPEQAPSLSPG